MASDEPKQKWFQTWWGMLLLVIGGAVAPQLCGLIPVPAGALICNTAVRSTVVYFTGAPAPAHPVVTDTVQPVVEECPPDRRLSTGKCLP